MDNEPRPAEILEPEELGKLLPFFSELDANLWHVIGYDTYSREFYPLYQQFTAESQALLAALRYLVELERDQPSESSGGQSDEGIQDRVFILGPGGIFYRAVL